MDVLGPVLRGKYSPLQKDGNGLQSVYLAELPETMAHVLGGLVGAEFLLLTKQALDVVTDEKTRATGETEEMRVWEDHLVHEIKETVVLPETERQSLIMARHIGTRPNNPRRRPVAPPLLFFLSERIRTSSPKMGYREQMMFPPGRAARRGPDTLSFFRSWALPSLIRPGGLGPPIGLY